MLDTDAYRTDLELRLSGGSARILGVGCVLQVRSLMIKALKIIVQVVWAVAMITVGTTIGALYGWEHHGWLGAAVLGTIGFGVRALLAASPMLVLQLLQ